MVVACASIQKVYLPRVTFVVVLKRHCTRLFPIEHGDPQTSDRRSGNILPGTAVDTEICHSHEFNFYLCSDARFQLLLSDLYFLMQEDLRDKRTREDVKGEFQPRYNGSLELCVMARDYEQHGASCDNNVTADSGHILLTADSGHVLLIDN